MALLYVAEFTLMGYGGRGNLLPVPRGPALVVQPPIDFSLGEAKSVAFNDQTRYVLISADANCHFLFGTNPTATTSDMPLWSKMYAAFGVDKDTGMKISVIAAA